MCVCVGGGGGMRGCGAIMSRGGSCENVGRSWKFEKGH